MNLNLKSSKNKKTSRFSKLISKSDKNFDDIIPDDDIKYYDDYDEIILNDDMLSYDKVKLSKDFYCDNDDLNYID